MRSIKKIVVVGSVSVDFVIEADKRPKKGETVFGKNFCTKFGGKGANQAVAAARLGSEVVMVGCVGSDMFGSEIVENLKKNGVCVDNIKKIENISSGVAIITLAENDNSIIVAPGANAFVEAPELEDADCVIVQGETPIETTRKIAQICEENKIIFIYNPAPITGIEKEIIPKATYVTPNETEVSQILPELSVSEAVAKYPNVLIVTLGDKGALYHDGEKEIHVPTTKVTPVDTTGAGDTFNGAFANAITNGKSIYDAVVFANKAASISVTKLGAQEGMPYKEIYYETGL